MIYLDTSCLIKLLVEEPESQAVREAISQEGEVVVSILAELETELQFKAARLAGKLRTSQWKQYNAKLRSLRGLAPFLFVSLPGTIFDTALRQHQAPNSNYCRLLDRLHLAALEELQIRRLMTCDDAQASAATALGLKILRPGRK